MSSVQPIIHIGYQHCMATWLQYKVFAANPERLRIVCRKHERDQKSRNNVHIVKGHPFSREFAAERESYRAGIAEAAKDGSIPILTNEAFSGNPFMGGSQARNIAEFFHDLAPDAKILISVREQISFIIAIYGSYVHSGGCLDIGNFLSRKLEKSTKITPFLLSFCDYYAYYSYYSSLFGKENVLILPVEQFRNDTDLYLSQLYDFIGLPIPNHWPDTSVYVDTERPHALAGLTRIANRILHHYELSSQRDERRRGSDRIYSLIAKLDQLVPEGKEAKALEKINKITSSHVGNYYAEGNSKLSSETSIDLASYGYKI